MLTETEALARWEASILLSAEVQACGNPLADFRVRSLLREAYLRGFRTGYREGHREGWQEATAAQEEKT